jgi:hypothetical protein
VLRSGAARKCPVRHEIDVARTLLYLASKARTNMKKVTKKKLALTKQSVRVLLGDDLANVVGGWIKPPITWSCPQPTAQSCAAKC